MKLLTSFLFLCFFVFTTVGYYASFLIKNAENKNAVRELMKEDRFLETIRIHRSELNQIEFKDKGKELIYKGEMYDIERQYQEGDFIVFRCINDKKEKELLAELEFHVNNNFGSETGQKKGSDPSKNLLKDLFLHGTPATVINTSAFIFRPLICNPISHIPAILPLPPPEWSFC